MDSQRIGRSRIRLFCRICESRLTKNHGIQHIVNQKYAKFRGSITRYYPFFHLGTRFAFQRTWLGRTGYIENGRRRGKNSSRPHPWSRQLLLPATARVAHIGPLRGSTRTLLTAKGPRCLSAHCDRSSFNPIKLSHNLRLCTFERNSRNNLQFCTFSLDYSLVGRGAKGAVPNPLPNPAPTSTPTPTLNPHSHLAP